MSLPASGLYPKKRDLWRQFQTKDRHLPSPPSSTSSGMAALHTHIKTGHCTASLPGDKGKRHDILHLVPVTMPEKERGTFSAEA